MISNEIADWQISASSRLDSDSRCLERYARVFQPSMFAWCAKYKSSTEWLQIDLGAPGKVRIIDNNNR